MKDELDDEKLRGYLKYEVKGDGSGHVGDEELREVVKAEMDLAMPCQHDWELARSSTGSVVAVKQCRICGLQRTWGEIDRAVPLFDLPPSRDHLHYWVMTEVQQGDVILEKRCHLWCSSGGRVAGEIGMNGVDEEKPLVIVLLDQVLSLIRQSGATRLEAESALSSALELLPALDLCLVRPGERYDQRVEERR